MADIRLLALTHLAAAGFAFSIAPRELLETEVKHSGFFKTDTKRVLAAAVESLRSENKLLVYSYKGFAAVSVERDGFLILNGRLDLIVPAGVNFFVDLTRLTPDKVTYDEQAKVLTVRLAPLVMGDVAFEPEGATVKSGGVLAWRPAEVEELRRISYATARRAFVKQAQGATLVQAAKAQARMNVANCFELPLRSAGLPDVKVLVVFGDDG